MSEGVYHIVLGVDERPARLLAETGDGPLLLKRGRAALHAYDRAELDRLDEVARRVMSLSTRPSLAELLDDTRFDATSPFITEAVAASFARFADDREPDVEKLGDAWTRALAEKKPRSYSFAPARGFQHGFTYTHRGLPDSQRLSLRAIGCCVEPAAAARYRCGRGRAVHVHERP